MTGFSRTIAEIEWLLVILVLLYQVVQGRDDETAAPIYLGVLLFSTFVIAFRSFYVQRGESHWKLAIETWVMIIFITWILYHTGRLESPSPSASVSRWRRPRSLPRAHTGWNYGPHRHRHVSGARR